MRGGALDACWCLVAVLVSNMVTPFVRCTDSVPRRHMVFKHYTGFTDLLKSLLQGMRSVVNAAETPDIACLLKKTPKCPGAGVWQSSGGM